MQSDSSARQSTSAAALLSIDSLNVDSLQITVEPPVKLATLDSSPQMIDSQATELDDLRAAQVGEGAGGRLHHQGERTGQEAARVGQVEKAHTQNREAEVEAHGHGGSQQQQETKPNLSETSASFLSLDKSDSRPRAPSRSVTLASISARTSSPRSDPPSFNPSCWLSFEKPPNHHLSLASYDQSSQEVAADRISPTSVSPSRDAQRRSEVIKQMNIARFPIVLKVLSLFRRSGRYPAFGASIDSANLNLDDFDEHYRHFLRDRAASGLEEEGGVSESELEPLPTSTRCSRIVGTAMVSFFELFAEDADLDSGLQRFWLDFAADYVKEN